jgi:hypothetical protein
MAKTLTLKKIPDHIYDRLKASAEANRRSLNSEAIVCLETVLAPAQSDPGEWLARARRLRAGLSGHFEPQDIERLKQQGRP